MKYGLIDCRPAPVKMIPVLQRIKERSGVTYTSLERTQAAVNFARARGCSLCSQPELFAMRPPCCCNPANPPGRSTHERRNDGVAYPGPAGMPLLWYQLGIDNTNSPALIAAAKAEGWIVTVTYPFSASERHHVNFRKAPILSLFRPLKRGSTGPRVKRLSKRLSRLRRPADADHRALYLDGARSTYDAEMETAVRKFQDDHRLKDDGVYGAHSAKQLGTALRRQKRQEKIWKAKFELDRIVADHKSASERLVDQRRAQEKANAAGDTAAAERFRKQARETAARIEDLQKTASAKREAIRKLGGDPDKAVPDWYKP